VIDLRSDTVTRPDAGMRASMSAATVGDDVFGDDPIVNALEARLAELSGKEAAVLLPSGSQSNLCALLSHCQRGEEYIVGQDYHSYLYEAGSGAVLGSIQPQPVEVDADGSLDLDRIKALIKPRDSHFARSKLLVLENTHNGKVISRDYMAAAFEFARSQGLSVHLDGARVFNAAAALRTDVTEIARHADSVSICCSKGLGAPVGSLLCGSTSFIEEARRWCKMAGGSMRQAGILAATIDYTLDNNIARLSDDHDNAQRLVSSLQTLEGLEILSADTNMIFTRLPSQAIGKRLERKLAEHDVIIIGGRNLRLAAHLDVSAADVEFVGELFQQLLPELIDRL